METRGRRWAHMTTSDRGQAGYKAFSLLRPVDRRAQNEQVYPHNPRSTATRASGPGGLSARSPLPARYSPDSPNDLLEGAILVSRFTKVEPEDPRGAGRRPGSYRWGIRALTCPGLCDSKSQAVILNISGTGKDGPKDHIWPPRLVL